MVTGRVVGGFGLKPRAMMDDAEKELLRCERERAPHPNFVCPGEKGGGGLCALRRGNYLTQCIHQLVLESQLPHRIVNLLFTITNEK